MALTNEVKQHVEETMQLCRREVDLDLHQLREQLRTHTITEEQAEAIATRAAEKAISPASAKAKQELIDDVKMEIADTAIGVLKNAIRMIALFIVGLGFYLSEIKLPWK